MKAIIVSRPGSDGQLEIVDLPDPHAPPGHVVVKVGATAANNADLLLRRGVFGAQPRVPGIDVAGIVVERGIGADAVEIGTRVVLNPAVTCGVCDYCRAGDHGTCPRRQTLGQLRDGGYAEYTVIPIENVHALADDVTFEQAATIPTNFMTAWQMLFHRAHLEAGQTVLVTAAAGGVGSAALRIAQLAGARVIATVGSEAKRSMVAGWGAESTINHETDDIGEAVLALTGGRGVDIVIDVIGGNRWGEYARALRAGGHLVTCSASGGNEPAITVRDLLVRRLVISGAGGLGAKAIAGRVVSLVNEGRLRGHVDRVLPLRDAEAAHRAIRDRAVVGKIVLTPGF